MNNKIPFNQLASKMAERAALSVPGAESVIKAFFAVVEEGLAENESVKIKGLGTFSLSGNPESPVIFEPDKEVAEAVNAPFAMFVTEELNPGVSESMLESVEAEAKVAEVAPIATVAEPEPEVPEIPEIPEIPAIPPTPTPPPPPAVVKEVVVEEPAIEENVEEPVEETIAAPTVQLVEEPPYEEPVEEEEEEVQQSSTFWPGFIIGLVTGLAIGALAVFIYMSENLSSEQPVANPAELVSTK